MYKYTKIETPFKRDENGTKKLIEGDWRNGAVEFLKDNMWYFTEKVDGTNIGIHWDGHKVNYQGRTERSQIPAHLMNKLIEIFGSNEAEEMFEQLFGENEMVLFGEGYGVKIQNGGNYISNGVDFILFDVYSPNTDTWLDRNAIVSIANALGIKVVPTVLIGTVEEAIEYIKTKPKSQISDMANMEGVVGKPLAELRDRCGNRIIVKIKVKDFE